MILIIIFLRFAHVLSQEFDYFPIVSAPFGKYMGSLSKTRLGKPIYQFRGIRYAKAPTNELRFKPPILVDIHQGIYNATENGPYCPQHNMNFSKSEDCLMLNVFSTRLPKSHKNVRKPVIVFIYSGGFYSFGAPYFGPQYIMDQDIVLVTLNYRLGALGFLATGTREAPGNNALKDQVMALKWIQLNIGAFGGDPNSVTLLGCGAGARSVTLHMVSPMTNGLFHKAIALSGSAISPNPIGAHQLELARKQATIVGCDSDTPERIVNCLGNVSSERLGDSTPLFAEWMVYPVLRWKYVIEPDFGQERFLTDHPLKLIKNGQFHNVPFMAGITRDEFSFKAIELAKNPILLNTLDKNWDYLAPMILHLDRNTTRTGNLTSNLRKLYFGNNSIDQSQAENLGRVFAEVITEIGINRAVRLISRKNTQPCFYSVFSYEGEKSNYLDSRTHKPVVLPIALNHLKFSGFHQESFIETQSSLGLYFFCQLRRQLDMQRQQTFKDYLDVYRVMHHDDLIYLFNTKDFSAFSSDASTTDAKMVETLSKLYANFAKYGTPTAKHDHFIWKPYHETTKNYLEINSPLKLKSNLNEERYHELEKIFEEDYY